MVLTTYTMKQELYTMNENSTHKNDKGTELTFLDSLKFNWEGKEEVFSCF